MSTPANVTWLHANVTGNSHGVAIQQVSCGTGTHAIAGGGFAGGSSSSTDTSGNDAQGVAPMIGSYLDYDSGTDTTVFTALFAVPDGVAVRAHVWAATA